VEHAAAMALYSVLDGKFEKKQRLSGSHPGTRIRAARCAVGRVGTISRGASEGGRGPPRGLTLRTVQRLKYW